MPLKFTQSFEDLKAILVKLDSAGEWVDLNQNQKQFRHESGAILNWFPSTGTINFQGKSAAAVELEKTVGALLNQEPAEAPPSVLASGAENQTYSTDLPQFTIDELSPLFLGNQYSDTELVIALIGTVGTELNRVKSIISDRFRIYNYSCENIYISTDIISELIAFTANYTNEYERSSKLMDYGSAVRRRSGDSSALALGAAAKISQMHLREGPQHEPAARRRKAYIINSLKHPAEVQRLREVLYPWIFRNRCLCRCKKTI